MGLCIFFSPQNHGDRCNLIKLRSTIHVSCFPLISATGEIILMKILNLLLDVIFICHVRISHPLVTMSWFVYEAINIYRVASERACNEQYT